MWDRPRRGAPRDPLSPRRLAGGWLAALVVAALPESVAAGPGDIFTVAGTGVAGEGGDGGAAIAGQLRTPRDVALAPDGSIYIADLGNHRVRKVDPGGVLSTVAGTGVAGYNGDGVPATAARLNFPAGVAVDAAGHLYIADKVSDRIRRVDADTQLISTFAGNGFSGSSGDGGPATAARLNDPSGLAFGPDGSLYIADEGNSKIRRVDPFGTITTVAGTGFVGFQGDFGPAVDARLAHPSGVAVAPDGTLYIADKGNERIRRVDTDGIITTIAGSTPPGYAGDGGPAVAAKLATPFDVAIAANGHLYIADSDNHRIREIDAAGIITTLGGTGIAGYCCDGGPAVSAELRHPESVAVDAAHRVFVADENNHRIRRIDDTCGNGQVDEGEPCELGDGEVADPSTCCLPGCQVRPAGEVCRPAADECDLADSCDGVAAACPADAVHPDGDADGFCDPIDVCPVDFDPAQEDRDEDGPGDACDPCTNLFGITAGKARITVTKLDKAPGKQKLQISGRFVPFPAAPPPIDPVQDGVRILVADAAGLRIDATLPGGAYDAQVRAGWKLRDRGGRFVATYSNAGKKVPLVAGLKRVKLSVDLVEGIERFKIVAKGADLPLEPGEEPLHATLVFDPPTAADGHCGELLFEAPPPHSPSCFYLRNGATLVCR